MTASKPTSAAVLDQLFETIASRRGADPKTSYTAQLLASGREKCAQKLGEEAVETVIAAARPDNAGLAEESADLLYHLLVVWAEANLAPSEVYGVLAKRQGQSGLEEKAARPSR